MVLGPEFVEAVRRGDVDWVADWLESLERPEDINDVNAEGKTVLSISRCKECVRVSADEIDIDAIAHTLATLNT